MSLQEFETLTERMMLAFEYAENLGQYVDAAKVLYQLNDQLPENLQLVFEDLESPDAAKLFIIQYKPKLKHAIAEYRQMLMMNF